MADPLQVLLESLRRDPRFVRNVTAWRTLPPCGAGTEAWLDALDPRLSRAGAGLGIAALYTHQSRAVAAALEGRNVVLATGTASGKTLGYVAPVLNTLLHEPKATALMIFPTKALAHDQIAALERWVAALQTAIALRTYDGDTPASQRAGIRKEARILITNPDMVHLGILPHHTQWMRFFQGLRYVVLDELHTYRGVFGSHVANVMRRLKRVAEFYGADPRLISASATIANAQALAEMVWEEEVEVVDEDAAPYGQRHILFYNPPLLNPALGLRASAADEALSLVMRLLRAGVQTIVFARTRLTVELLLRDLRGRAKEQGLDPEVVQGYRGGYLPHERRAIERDLREGRTRVVIATTALELGIDIGALDASVLVGYPGTIAATLQQMGRAGRRSGTSLSILVATAAPLDQYLVMHPEYFFGRSPETAYVNPNALSLLSVHLACAAFELPFGREEGFGKIGDVSPVLDALCEDGVLHRSRGQYTWVAETYPAQAVSLRTATADTVIVRSVAGGLIGTVDRLSAPALVHEGAVYFHAGEVYLIESLDWEQGLAHARPTETDYYTMASSSTVVECTALRTTVSGAELGSGAPQQRDYVLTEEEVTVHTKPTAYRRVALSTHTTLGWGEIDLPEQTLDTEAFRLTLGAALVDALAQEGILVAPLDYGPEWPAIRASILERDGCRCAVCGTPAHPGHELEVHHVVPLRAFLSKHPREVALRLAHAAENLLTLCPKCHREVERSRGAHTALGGFGYLLINLAPMFLMCDPGDLGSAVEARDAETGQPAIVIYDAIPGGAGLSSHLVGQWERLVSAAAERVERCPCSDGCPSCVGPAGETELGTKEATRRLLSFLSAGLAARQ